MVFPCDATPNPPAMWVSRIMSRVFRKYWPLGHRGSGGGAGIHGIFGNRGLSGARRVRGSALRQGFPEARACVGTRPDSRTAGLACGGRGRRVLADPARRTGQRSAFTVDTLQVAGGHEPPVHRDDAVALEAAVKDRLGQVVVVQRRAPVLERLVGGEQQRTPLEAAGVDDVEEDIGGIGAVAELAEFVHEEHSGPDIGLKGCAEAALAAGAAEVIDERRGRRTRTRSRSRAGAGVVGAGRRS